MMVGDTLSALRRARGFTQEVLAARARITPEYLSMIETGARRNPSLAVLARVAAALAVPVSALLDVAATEEPSKGRGRHRSTRRRKGDSHGR